MNNFQSQRPFGYKSLKYRRNDTKMIKSFFIVNDFMGVRLNDDEAMISIDHDKYFFKYSCAEAMGRVSGLFYQANYNKQDKFSFDLKQQVHCICN